jgi:hypothetical protein
MRQSCRLIPDVLSRCTQVPAELANSYPGTINVDLGSDIDFLKADFEVPRIGGLAPVEFVRVGVEFPIGNLLDAKAWIYQPYGYHWGVLNRKTLIEILVDRRIEEIKPGTGQCCRVHVLTQGSGKTSTTPEYLNYIAAKKGWPATPF